MAEKPHDAVVKFDTCLSKFTAASHGSPCDSTVSCFLACCYGRKRFKSTVFYPQRILLRFCSTFAFDGSGNETDFGHCSHIMASPWVRGWDSEGSAVLRKRNASIKKYHKNAKINFMKAQEKLYGNARQKCTKAHSNFPGSIVFNASDRKWNCYSWVRLPSSANCDHQWT